MFRLVSKITKIANQGKIGGKTGLRKGEKGLALPGGNPATADVSALWTKGKTNREARAVSIYYLFCSA